jgi:predicted ABC-type ATPase
VSGNWDESKHPRKPSGASGSAGGEFDHSGGSGGARRTEGQGQGASPKSNDKRSPVQSLQGYSDDGRPGYAAPIGIVARGDWAQAQFAYPPLDPEGADTRSRFSDGKGNYTKERQALHRAIVAKYLANTTPVDSPLSTILGGGPASGKSSAVTDHENTVHVDTDKIRAELPEYQEQVGINKAISAYTHEEASEIAKMLTKAAAEGNRNVLLDGTGDGTISKLAERVTFLRSKGYRVVGKYTVLDPDIAMVRMLERGKLTGRYVPEDFLRDTHRAVARVVPEAVRRGLFDDLEVYDNSTTRRLIARARGGVLDIYDPVLWAAFLRRSN